MADTNFRPADAVASTDTGTDSETAGSRPAAKPGTVPKEVGGREGPEPTRFGDWEKAGRCIDF